MNWCTSVLSGPVPIIHKCTSSYSDIVHLVHVIHCCEKVHRGSMFHFVSNWTESSNKSVISLQTCKQNKNLLFFNFHGYIFITNSQDTGHKAKINNIMFCNALQESKFSLHAKQNYFWFSFKYFWQLCSSTHNTEKYLQRYKKYLEIYCVLLNLAISHVFN